jgi:hypothetical protein
MMRPDNGSVRRDLGIFLEQIFESRRPAAFLRTRRHTPARPKQQGREQDEERYHMWQTEFHRQPVASGFLVIVPKRFALPKTAAHSGPRRIAKIPGISYLSSIDSCNSP